MFQFTPFPAKRYRHHCWHNFTFGYPKKGGFPHSDIIGSKVYGTYPMRIAAIYVLPRPKSPRHPLLALWVDFKDFYPVDASPLPKKRVTGFFSLLVKEPISHYVLCTPSLTRGRAQNSETLSVLYWWTVGDSNSLPLHCKWSVLPAELTAPAHGIA